MRKDDILEGRGDIKRGRLDRELNPDLSLAEAIAFTTELPRPCEITLFCQYTIVYTLYLQFVKVVAHRKRKQ